MDALRPGDVIRVRPGERIAVDGTIVEGSASVSEAEITGESVPASRGPGDAVAAGTLNQDGSLLVEARRTGAETTVARLVKLVAESRAGRYTLAPLVDRLSAAFVPFVLLVADGHARVLDAPRRPRRRPHERALGPPHRLPVRDRHRDAARLDGGRRAGRVGGRPRAVGRRVRGARAGEARLPRQDGHAHDGRPLSRGRAARARFRPPGPPGARGGARARQRTPGWPRDLRGGVRRRGREKRRFL